MLSLVSLVMIKVAVVVVVVDIDPSNLDHSQHLMTFIRLRAAVASSYMGPWKPTARNGFG